MLTNVEEVARGLEHDVVVVPVADAKHVGHHAVACARSWEDMYCQEQKKKQYQIHQTHRTHRIH